MIGDLLRDWMRGVVAVSVGHTLSTPIKSIYGIGMTHDINNRQSISTIRDIVGQRGVKSLWRGNLTAVLNGVTSTAVEFAVKDCFNKLMIRRLAREQKSVEMTTFAGINFLAGGLAGFARGLAVAPFFVGKYKSYSKFTVEKRNKDGVHRFSKESIKSNEFWKTKLTAVTLTRAMYFGIYDTLAAPSMNAQQPIIAKLIFAEISVIAANMAGHPFERMLHLLNMSKSGQVSKDFLSMSMPMLAYSIFKNEGLAGLLWRHLPHMYTTLPGALILVVYDKLKHQEIKYRY